MPLNELDLPKELQPMYEKLRLQNEDGTDQDVMPSGFGEFGLEITNPVPTDTIIGSQVYLASLRTEAGETVQFERMGSGEAPNFDKPIDMFQMSVGGKRIGILYLCPYNKRNSGKAPKGFKIL